MRRAKHTSAHLHVSTIFGIPEIVGAVFDGVQCSTPDSAFDLSNRGDARSNWNERASALLYPSFS